MDGTLIMPGPVSDSSKGPGSGTPYVPSWCYDDVDGPLICACGHHEGYHADDGECNQRHVCNCDGFKSTGKREPPVNT